MKIEGSVSFRTILRNVRHGFKTLSYMNWVSASGFQVAGLLGVVGLILAIRDGKVSDLSSLRWFSERASRSKKLQLVPGLQNLGNNCFLNVILQALASCFHFQPFLQKVIEDCQLSMEEEQVASLPLAAALATLLEELCEVGRGYVVLSPRKVMLAMAHYIPNFNLTAQQDAAEAFLHLWSSLREEFSDCYLPNQGSLADVCASSRRILNPKREDQTEQERWQHSFLGPFDGIISSILTCESCSSQISLSFESFHSLPLAPVLSNGTNIMMGCTLEDCLKQFIVAEHVENYCCSHCWHIAGIKYLSSVGANEMEIEKLRRCSEQEDCDCQRLLCLERLPWSNNFSYTLKQLSIARCPKILCIHLKRVAINIFGEPVKLQDHISFPLSMDLLPFMTIGVEIKSWGESLLKKQVTQQCEKTKPFANHLNVQFDTMKLNFIYGLMRENVNSKELDPDESQCSLTVQSVQAESNLGQTEGCSESIPGGHMQSHNSKELDPDESQCSLTVQSVQAESNLGQTEGCSESIPGGHMQSHNSKELDPDESQCSLTVQSVQAEPNLGQTEGCSESIPGAMHMQSHYKETAPPESHLYRLVSVVEHLGRAGSGHYTVYRSVRAHSNKDVPDDESEPGSMRWFCVSDSEVHGVSEKEVLDAEATLLFYEKII